jgi:hypothetical protein
MTKYGVFIIESLRHNDHTDGKTLHQILKLSRIRSNYNWVNSVDDFINKLSNFSKSSFRYLHVSCHSDESGFEINGKYISNLEFKNLTQKHIEKRRIFLSSCKSANLDIASKLIIDNGAMSVIGTPIDLRFDKSVLFWSSFYHTMNEIDNSKMKREDIKITLKKCVELFGIPINYYTKHTDGNRFLRRFKIRQNKSIDNRLVLRKY